jgi:hypothetical protein
VLGAYRVGKNPGFHLLDTQFGFLGNTRKFYAWPIEKAKQTIFKKLLFLTLCFKVWVEWTFESQIMEWEQNFVFFTRIAGICLE